MDHADNHGRLLGLNLMNFVGCSFRTVLYLLLIQQGRKRQKTRVQFILARCAGFATSHLCSSPDMKESISFEIKLHSAGRSRVSGKGKNLIFERCVMDGTEAQLSSRLCISRMVLGHFQTRL